MQSSMLELRIDNMIDLFICFLAGRAFDKFKYICWNYFYFTMLIILFKSFVINYYGIHRLKIFLLKGSVNYMT